MTAKGSADGGAAISGKFFSALPKNLLKPQLPILPKINAAFSLNTAERKTPTPPLKAVSVGQTYKRKTPTPPQIRNTPTPPGVSVTAINMPMIASVQSMSASATPPLQLLATPPHTPASLNEPPPLTISPRLPQSTSITLQTNVQTNNTTSSRKNDDFKIHLPCKRTFNSTIKSPTTSPRLKTPPLTPSNASVGRASPVVAVEKSVRRVVPTTLLKRSDEVWLQRQTYLTTQTDDEETILPTAEFASIMPIKTKVCSTIKSPNIPISLKSATITKVLSPKQSNSNLDTVVLSPCTPPKDVKVNGDSRNNSQSPPDAETTASDQITKPSVEKDEVRAPLEPTYQALIKACRNADPSSDMEKLINDKLIKYYYEVHPDFVRSRGFRKNLCTVIERIELDPDLVYYNLKTIVDELKVRRKSRAVVLTNEDANITTTGNKRTDEQIKKLNKALYILTKRIETLEESEVDWDDDDSSYMQVERFKKRACQIYEKICDLTGEGKNAHRLVRKPIQFTGTPYTQYNKTLQAFVNRTKEFPDFHDVLHMLEHCNRQYDYGLGSFEMKRIAHEAFIKVGRLLQSRRKTDLYETVTHYTANRKDPASSDPVLMAKLSENQKNYKKIGEIIEKFAREQNLTTEEQKEARLQQKQTPKDVNNGTQKDKEKGQKEGPETNISCANNDDDEEESDDDDAEEDVDDDELEVEVNKLANGDVTDVESDAEEKRNLSSTKSTKEMETFTKATKSDIKTITAAELPIEQQKPDEQNAAIKCDKTQNVLKEHDKLKKTINNNIERTKTVDIVDLASDTIRKGIKSPVQVKQVPNGELNKSVGEVRDVTTTSATTTATARTITISASVRMTTNNATATIPTKTVNTPPPPSSIRIVSVSSLNGTINLNENSNSNSKKIELSNNKKVVTSDEKLKVKPAKTATCESQSGGNATAQTQKLRTVAEIVISDEES